MDIIIATKNQVVEPGSKINTDAICEGRQHIPEGAEQLHLAPGQASCEIQGEDILVTGLYYKLGWNEYDLSGYGIKARLTPNGAIIPYLRTARGKEANIKKNKDGVAANAYWPIIEKIQQEENPYGQDDDMELAGITEDAMLYISDEHFDDADSIDNDEFHMMNEMAMEV